MVARYQAFQRQKNLADTYIRSTRWTLQRLERFLGVPLGDATEEQLADWYTYVTLTLTASARSVYLAQVAGFYGWLVRERIRVDDPTIRLPRPKNKRGLPRPMSDASLRLALKSAPADIRAFLILGAYCGLRAGEMAGLHGEDIQRHAVPPILIVRDGKGGKQRVVPLHPLVLDELAFLPESGPLFRDWRGRQLGANTVSQRACKYLRRISLTETLHQTRHAFATNVYRQSRDLRLTQELCGHASPNTTARYAAWAPEEAAAVVDALPPVGDPRPPDRIVIGETRQRILDCVREYGPLKPKMIAEHLNIAADNIQHTLARMVDDRQLVKDRGNYMVPVGTQASGEVELSNMLEKITIRKVVDMRCQIDAG